MIFLYERADLAFPRPPVQVVHMRPDQPYDRFRLFFGRFQPFQNRPPDAHALRVVAVVFAVRAHAVGLAYVVQQGGEPHFFIGVSARPQRMFQHVVRVEVAPLQHPPSRGKFGQDLVEHARFVEDLQSLVLRARPAVFFVRVQQQRQFRKDAFRRNFPYFFRVFYGAGKAVFIGREAELRRKPRQAHQP